VLSGVFTDWRFTLRKSAKGAKNAKKNCFLSSRCFMLSAFDRQIGVNLSTCHACPRRQDGSRGKCACLLDGRDITEHAEAGDCPLGKHSVPPARGLGDSIARAITAVGADRISKALERATGRPCGCKRRQAKLNELVPYEKKK